MPSETLYAFQNNLKIAKQILNPEGGYDKKAFRRLLNVVLTLFDMHLSKKRFRFKVP
jgi:hypothetical protein